MRKLISTIAKETFINSWWVILFALFCFMVYEQGLKTSNERLMALSNQLDTLQGEKKKVLKQQVRLSKEVESQDDPDWIELTLMKELGLTPEGHTKVLFY
ncbi:MAG: hypothetical protein H0U49_10070 [Parachlamydiaceae bacterium]|nr:hypothetical protein [Parachlamydiaceae bacterium]